MKANKSSQHEIKILEGVTALHKKGNKGVRIVEFARYAKKHDFCKKWEGVAKANYVKTFEACVEMKLLKATKSGSGTYYKPDMDKIKL